MSKKILIVESDTAFSQKLKDELAKTGFEAIDTGDGKAAYDLCRRERPDLMVLAVELSAGQSGYLVCGKIKKDDDLKKTPVIIIGKDPEGFEGHKKLKTRAEEYLKKPFAPEALTVKIGVLIGLPERADADEALVVDDESLTLTSMDDEPLTAAEPALDVEAASGPTLGGDPELDMLDEAFESLSEEPQAEASPAPAVEPEPAEAVEDDLLAGLEEVQEEAEQEAHAHLKPEVPADVIPGEEEPPQADLAVSETEEDAALATLGGEPEPISAAEPVEDLSLESIEIDTTNPRIEVAPRAAAAAPRRPPPSAGAAVVNREAEVQQLRERIADLEETIASLENDLAAKGAELAGAKAGGGSSKDVFALKDAATKKDKEILRLKQELHEKETELLEIREKETGLERDASEHAGEIAKRDAQIKSLQQKADLLAAEKRRNDTATAAAKDEARTAAASLATVQGELDQAQDQLQELTRELEELRGKTADVDGLRAELDGVRAELEQVRAELSTAHADAEQRQRAIEDEAQQLRARIAELEQANARNEDRVVKAYQKIKGDEKVREKTKKAISVALQLLDESSASLDVEKDLHP